MTEDAPIAFLCRKPWQWGNGSGAVFSRDFRLLPDGAIGGYRHPNEARWRWEDGKIVIFTAAGQRSAELAPEADARATVFKGRFLLDPAGQTIHVLSRREPAAGCFFRTHFWGEDVQAVYEAVQAVWPAPVVVAADQTRPFAVPEGLPVLGHKLADFENYTLSMSPQVGRPLWYFGDYPLYHICLHSDCDYFFMTEYDTYIEGIDLRALADRFIADELDFVGVWCGPYDEKGAWYQRQREWLQAETGRPADSDDLTPYWVYFPLVFISRPAAMHLFARRIEVSRLHDSGRIPLALPFCETFVPTELRRAGFRLARLHDFLAAKSDFTTRRTLAEARQSGPCMLHPVRGLAPPG